jgi:lysophospholipase L1-like esterase
MAGFFQCVILILFLSACGGGGGSNAPPPAPSATTTGANPISNDNAVLNGDLNPNGLVTTAWFEYGQDNALSTFSKTADQAIGSGTGPVPVDETIFNLTAGTTYYFRVAAQNSAGLSKGAIEGFIAALLPPTVSTLTAGPISNDNAVLNGDVNPKGLPTSAWFEWGPDPTLNARTITSNDNVGAGAAFVTIQAPLTNLAPGTTYYFRVVAQNTTGTSKGTIKSFKASQIPSATTNAATSVTSNGATLNGSVNPNGLPTNYWFLWGTDPILTNPALTSETLPILIPGGTFTTQPVSAPLSGLGVGTNYYFRVVASNVEGESQGTIHNFQTSVSPTVTTIEPATSITTSGAVLHGDVNPNGFATDAWFEYGTDPALSSPAATVHVPKGSGTTTLSFNASISGLNPWRTYYYRAAASNSGGTQKGVIRSFPTGEYYVAVGDSITAGSQDDNLADGIGFEPILNNLLTAAKGYPHTVVNEGVSGDTSADGAALISTPGPNNPLSKNPSAKYVLVLYGTNDAFIPAVSKVTYKSNMQAIITAIKNAGKVPYLGKVPFTLDPLRSDAAIQGYNAAIDELRNFNGIPVVAPDFYAWFLSHQSQLADGIHPNGTGYQSMANLWFNALP